MCVLSHVLDINVLLCVFLFMLRYASSRRVWLWDNASFLLRYLLLYCICLPRPMPYRDTSCVDHVVLCGSMPRIMLESRGCGSYCAPLNRRRSRASRL